MSMNSECTNLETNVPDLNDSKLSAHRKALPPCFQSTWHREPQPSIHSFESARSELKASLGPMATNLLFEEVGKELSSLETDLVIDCQYLVELNLKGMNALGRGDHLKARESLKLCETLVDDLRNTRLTLDERQKLFALTKNNLGCYY